MRRRVVPNVLRVSYPQFEVSKPKLRWILDRPKATHVGPQRRQKPLTAPSRPWKLVFYVAFETEESFHDFERYLKSALGKAFGSKRLW